MYLSRYITQNKAEYYQVLQDVRTKNDWEHLILYFLKSVEFRNALKEQVPGGIKTEIKPKHLLPLLVEIPTEIKDQKAVVKILQNRNSKVDAISTELTHQLTLVKKLRQQLLQGTPSSSFGQGTTSETSYAGSNVVPFPTPTFGGEPKVQKMEELEAKAIEDAISQYKGNLTEAAKALGIGRATLYRKVKQYQIDPSAARKRKQAA